MWGGLGVTVSCLHIVWVGGVGCVCGGWGACVCVRVCVRACVRMYVRLIVYSVPHAQPPMCVRACVRINVRLIVYSVQPPMSTPCLMPSHPCLLRASCPATHVYSVPHAQPPTSTLCLTHVYSVLHAQPPIYTIDRQ